LSIQQITVNSRGEKILSVKHSFKVRRGNASPYHFFRGQMMKKQIAFEDEEKKTFQSV
jgi:hypothetical protein